MRDVSKARAEIEPVGGVTGMLVASVLPDQFYTAAERSQKDVAERRLMAAILEDAVLVYQRHPRPALPRQQRLFCEAVEWLTNDDRTWAFSFMRICEALELDPSYLRRGLGLDAVVGVPAQR